MFFVYILRDKNGKLYIGYTAHIDNRLQQHINGETYTTSQMDDIQLFYYEAYTSQIAARERERKLKQFGSSYTGLIKRLKMK